MFAHVLFKQNNRLPIQSKKTMDISYYFGWPTTDYNANFKRIFRKCPKLHNKLRWHIFYNFSQSFADNYFTTFFKGENL